MTATSIVVMGPAASGKTTIGKLLAARLNLRFLDGDDFHPASNVQKMASGIPLNDEDRAPWLDHLAGLLEKAAGENQPIVLACSALKESYRQRLTAKAAAHFVFLDVPIEVLRERLQKRKGHFLPAGLLVSQMADLQRPFGAIAIDASSPPKQVVDDIVARLPPA